MSVNVRDFGADPTGVADSAPAFMNALASFGPPDESFAGTVMVPFGTYCFESPVRIKKSVLILGEQGASMYRSVEIVPDPGIEAFVFETEDSPAGTSSAGNGQNAQIQGLLVRPAAKVQDWQSEKPYDVGDKVRTGTGKGEDWRRHYVCTKAGTSAGPGSIGPRSLGNDKILKYDGQVASFRLGEYVTGETSGANGIVIADSNAGANGELRLTSVSGTFQDDENLTMRDVVNDKDVVHAVADGPSIAAGDDEPDNDVRWRYLGSGAGIRIRTNGCTLRDVTVLEASGNGVHIEAADLEVPEARTNANAWHLDNVNIWECDGHGLYVNGVDANGGSFVHGVLAGNGAATSQEDFTGQGYNIYDSSFLGNTYVAINMEKGGQGSIHSDSVGGGSTFIGCYQEGSGGGENFISGTCVIVGGGLSSGIFEAASIPVVLGPFGQSRGQGFAVAGWGGAPWRANVAVKLGNRRVNGSRLYEVIKEGVTDGPGGGPTGTGADIVDGTARWAFVHDVTDSGVVTLGSADPLLKTFFTAQAPDDMRIGLPTYYRYDSFGGCTEVQGFQYGASGTGTNDSGPGLMHAVNRSKLDEWPMHVPAGRALFEMLWIGGRRITAGTTTDAPAAGTWNPGDRIYFKGAAAVAGGAEGLECVAPGTAGDHGGARTATADGSNTVAISGPAMSTYVDQQDFKVGDMLRSNGVTGRVLAASDDGLTLTMESPVAAGAGLPIDFAAPVFEEFGRIAGGAGDSTAAPGDATLNTQKGRSAIAPGAASMTITNIKATPSSIIHATLQTVDATLTQILTMVPHAGHFVVTGNASATAAVNVCWSIEE